MVALSRTKSEWPLSFFFVELRWITFGLFLLLELIFDNGDISSDFGPFALVEGILRRDNFSLHLDTFVEILLIVLFDLWLLGILNKSIWCIFEVELKLSACIWLRSTMFLVLACRFLFNEFPWRLLKFYSVWDQKQYWVKFWRFWSSFNNQVLYTPFTHLLIKFWNAYFLIHGVVAVVNWEVKLPLLILDKSFFFAGSKLTESHSSISILAKLNALSLRITLLNGGFCGLSSFSYLKKSDSVLKNSNKILTKWLKTNSWQIYQDVIIHRFIFIENP